MAPETKTHADYTVGWVCALPKEQTAATAMLDKRHGNLPKPPHDSNTYTLGSIGQHNVVIACLPKGKYGTNSAANVATLMVATFPSIKIGLMVGIGGGIPPKVRLGDVVVSTPSGQFPGVVQWDIGKAKANGQFERTGALNNPPNALLSALAKLETEHDLSGTKIPHYLEELKQKYPRAAKKYLKSDSMQDVLFRADYDHVNKTSVEGDARMDDNDGNDEDEKEDNDDASDDSDDDEEESCRRCDKTKIVRRKRRGMRVHYGLVASGNQVIKDAAFRDNLNKDLGGNVLCFETEAAGLMNGFSCLVIRGICDYCDSHKNKAWQEHAAAVAAAFAKELLSLVQASDVEGERPVKDVLDDVKRGVKRVHKMVEDGFMQTTNNLGDLLKDKELAKQKAILNWLSQIDFAPQQHDFFSRCEPETGHRLLQSTEYLAWLATSKQTLFSPGIPGAGKTIQTSILVYDLVSRFNDDTTVGIAYIYCNFQRQQNQKAEHLLASLIRQLAQSQKPFPSSVQALYDRHQERSTRPLLEELSATLQSVGMFYSRVFIVIDALDECDDTDGSRTKLLDHLFSAQSKLGLNIFATSRFIPRIEERFKDYPWREVRPSHEDIFRFLDSRMSELPDFVTRDTDLQNEIKTEIELAMEGMFLLAQLYVDSLVGKRSPASLRQALKSLRKASAKPPYGSSALDEAYTKAMEHIEHQRGDLPRDALLTLSWIVNARRQLTVPELQEALAVEIGKPALDEDNIPTIGHITKACAPLIVVDAESNIVRLVHYTTQEYFERTQNIWFKNAQIDITRICITYLSFESGFCPSQDEFWDRLETNMLYDYAAQNWGHHACEALALDQDTLEVIDFLERKEKREPWSQALMAARSERWDESSQRVPRHMTALHLAGYFGLHNVAVTLLERGHDPNIMDSYEQTPLSYAVRNGHAPIVKLLLGQNVHPDPGKDSFYGSPLSWAARNGHEPVMKLLLEKDVDLGSKDEYGLTPLAWATKNGHAAVVERLLERGASQETTNCRGRTALSLAAANGREAVVKLLLAKNSNLEAKDEIGLTPLARAARNGHEVVVKLLLAKNSNLEAKDKIGLTPLAQAARNGREVVTKVLLDGKADVNAQDNGGTTVLHWATWEGHDAVVSLLLQRGAHTEIRNAGGGTALAAAIEKGSERIVKLLLGKGANVNYLYPFYVGKPSRWRAIHISGAEYEGDAEYESDEEYESDAESAVLSAYKYYQTKNDQGVLHHTFGSSEEPYGRRKVSPLWRAAERSDDTVVKLLQDSGAHLDFKVDGALTQLPLLWAVKNGYEGLVRLLLERGEDPNREDASGYNALLLAAENGHEGVVRLLLKRGVDPNAKDTSGASALTLATKRGRYGVFSLLLASGEVDVDMKDGVGRTPLSYAAGNTGDSHFVEVLLASGKVDADSKDHGGRTPLSYAAGQSHWLRVNSSVKLLMAASQVNPDSKDNIGRTPLSYASEYWGVHAVTLAEPLIDSGKVDPDSQDIDGRTPLSYARYKGVTQFLLASSRVNIESRDKIGRTPLSHAACGGWHEAVERLLEYGADRNSEDEFGQTPLMKAREGFEREVEREKRYLEEMGMEERYFEETESDNEGEVKRRKWYLKEMERNDEREYERIRRIMRKIKRRKPEQWVRYEKVLKLLAPAQSSTTPSASSSSDEFDQHFDMSLLERTRPVFDLQIMKSV